MKPLEIAISIKHGSFAMPIQVCVTRRIRTIETIGIKLGGYTERTATFCGVSRIPLSTRRGEW